MTEGCQVFTGVSFIQKLVLNNPVSNPRFYRLFVQLILWKRVIRRIGTKNEIEKVTIFFTVLPYNPAINK